jgi:hypothetical protein
LQRFQAQQERDKRGWKTIEIGDFEKAREHLF